jgi:DNA-binding GntR family transcriptional regulator
MTSLLVGTPGQRLASEAELVRRYGASRMTVFRAMHELQSLGIVIRRVGSGTFVSQNSGFRKS